MLLFLLTIYHTAGAGSSFISTDLSLTALHITTMPINFANTKITVTRKTQNDTRALQHHTLLRQITVQFDKKDFNKLPATLANIEHTLARPGTTCSRATSYFHPIHERIQ